MSTDLMRANRDTTLLAPQFREMVIAALSEAQLMGVDLHIYEGFRSLERQQYLWDSGRSRPGPIVTNAKPGQSAHNWGLAADLVAKVDGKWSWDEKKVPYKKLVALYEKIGLKSLAPFELVHVEYTGKLRTSEMAEFVRLFGMDALWSAVFR